MLLTIIVFILILSVLVLVHEAGHFFIAKSFGIKVEEFGFGLPPRIFGIKKGGTIYSLNWLPIGGFVKLYGEDDAGAGKVGISESPVGDSDVKTAFFAKPSYQRALVVFAGVVMNFLLSVVIIAFLFGFVGVSIPGNKVMIVEVSKDSPAFTAGLKPGDYIDSINNIRIKNDPQVLIDTTKKYLGKEIALKIEQGQTEKTLEIIPRRVYPKNEGPLGVGISPNIETKKYPWYEIPFAATAEASSEVWLIVKGLAGVVFELFVHGTVSAGVAGPVGIAELTGQFVKIGPAAVMSLVSLLSLNLAVLNILPIPALDGGRLFFILIEMISGKKINKRFENAANATGMALLLILIALITLHDIIKVITHQPLIPNP